MKLWQLFGVAAMAATSLTVSAQKVCRANVCTNTGALPDGTYRSYNGVPVQTPGNLPADAYTVDPRTGQKNY